MRQAPKDELGSGVERMKRPFRFVVLLVLLFTPVFGVPVVLAQALPPDLVLVNGTVLTVDDADTVAEALAIRAGRIVAVGTTSDIRKLAGLGTEVIDLNGRTATPGLIDTHLHVSPPSDELDLSDPDIRNIADLQARLRQEVAKYAPGEWVRGRGWDGGKLVERRFLRASDLDVVSPANPVWLRHTTGHYGVANTLALKLASVTRETVDPPAETLERDASGNPTGLMKESATGVITRVITGGGRGRGPGGEPGGGLAATFAGFNREGLTAVKDPGVTAGRFAQYRQMLDAGTLNVRVFALWRGGDTMASLEETIRQMGAHPRLPQTMGNGMLTSGGVKLYIDGSGGACTGWMHDDWNLESTGVEKGNKGYPTTDPAVFREQIRRLHDAGIHVGTHAVGDRGMDVVVDAYADALRAKPTRGLRHSIIHANLPTDHAIDTMAMLQKTYDAGYPELQPPFLWWIGDNYAGNYGPTRAPRLLPLRTMLKKGVRWAAGSDYYVTPFAPRYGLWASVVRKPLRGTYGETAFGLDEALAGRVVHRAP